MNNLPTLAGFSAGDPTRPARHRAAQPDGGDAATLFPGRETVHDGEPWKPNRHEYATWDAAYVLGSLSAQDRREFETHLPDCPSCWAAVTELSGIPALLALLDHDEVAALGELALVEGSADAATSDAGHGGKRYS